MNDYGFDYMNYITNIPNSMNYTKNDINYTMNKKNITNMMTNQQITDPIQGWLKGNLFVNLYEPYNNYKPTILNPKNERETLLYQIMQYKFALIELNLYLDTNPNDAEMIKLYNQYLTAEKQMCEKYENLYGPLTLDSNYFDKNTWVWKNSPWPWEVM